MLFLSMHCNKLKLNLLTFVLIFLAGSSFGQQYAEVRLKKGMVLKGEVLSVSKDKEVVLKATWKDSILLDWDDIAYIDFAVVQNKMETVQLVKPHYDFIDSALYGAFEARLGGGQSDWGAILNPGFKISLGKYLNQNRHLGLAACVGYDYMFNLTSDLVPLGVSLRGNLRDGGLSAFYDVGVGYSFAHDNNSSSQLTEKNGGAYINPSVGIISKKRPHVATYLKLGYNYTSYGEIYNEVIWQQWSGWTNVEVRRQYDLQSIRLSFGLYFD